jgi:hypothetical protein
LIILCNRFFISEIRTSLENGLGSFQAFLILQIWEKPEKLKWLQKQFWKLDLKTLWYSESILLGHFQCFWKIDYLRKSKNIFELSASKISKNYDFFLVCTTTKPKQFINKAVFLYRFFPWCCFGFINKTATTKKFQLIYDLSMLCLSLVFWYVTSRTISSNHQMLAVITKKSDQPRFLWSSNPIKS